MKVIHKLLVIVACCLPVQAFASEKLSVSELLDRYAVNQDKLKSFVVKSETIQTNLVTKDGAAPYSKVKRKIVEFRYEDSGGGPAVYYGWKEFDLGDNGIWVPEDIDNSFLWDGKLNYQYSKMANGSAYSTVHIIKGYEYARHGIGVMHAGACPILGILYGDVERFDSIFKQSKKISARSKLERIGSVDCYVIDAKTKHGTYTIWLDPEHGYGIAKAYVHKGPKDLRFGRPRSSYVVSSVEDSFFVENVRFENIEGIWVPMEADFRTDSKWLSTPKWPLSAETTDIHYKVTDLLLNPDHDALGSFVPDIENGTDVSIGRGPEYKWHNGKKFVVDGWDGRIRYVPKGWSILVGVGKQLPKFEGIKLKFSAEQTKDRAILLCFFDMEQRPSRNCVIQLAQKAEELKENGVTIAAVRTSKVTEKNLNEWKKKNRIPFPLGSITADIEKTRFNWGVRSLPWLILTDKQHVVIAEGFGPKELNDKIKATEPKPKAPANKHPSALDLLDRYAANQDKLNSFIMRAEINYRENTEDETTSHSPVKQYIFELRYENDDSDFHAYFCPKDVHSATDGSPILSDRYTSFLWDGNRYIQHYRGSTLDKSSVFVSFKLEYIKDAIAIGFAGPGSILGLLYGDVERFDSILKQADSISVRDEPERVGSGDCYVVDAKTKHGNYTIWLDPERGYGIATADVHKGPKDLRWGRPLDYFTHAPYLPNVISIRNVRFESIEGIWVPMEVDFRIDSKDFKGAKKAPVYDVHYRVTELLLNPDHDALGSFVPNIENGTRVRIQEAPGMRYTWDDGKKFVVDEWDGSIKHVPKDWSILVGVGKTLPKFEGIKLKLSDEQTKDRAILLCFFDMNQRPSRNCIIRLAKQAEQLKQKDIAVVAVQASKIDENTLNQWAKKYKIPFPVGIVQGYVEKIRFAWGVRSLPWLILTDRQHVVTAEGFTLDELNEKLGNNPKHKSGPTQ